MPSNNVEQGDFTQKPKIETIEERENATEFLVNKWIKNPEDMPVFEKIRQILEEDIENDGGIVEHILYKVKKDLTENLERIQKEFNEAYENSQERDIKTFEMEKPKKELENLVKLEEKLEELENLTRTEKIERLEEEERKIAS